MVWTKDGFAAPVGENDRAAEVAGFGSEQERDEGGDLFRAPASANRNRELVEERTDLLVPLDLCSHGGLDVAGSDGIEGYTRPPPLPFGGVAAHPPGDGQLGRRVGDRRTELVTQPARLLFVAGEAGVHERGRQPRLHRRGVRADGDGRGLLA